VKVMEINPERRRISLSMKAAAEELGFEIEVDESIQAEEKPAKKKAPKAEKPAEAAPAEEVAAE
ncbi:MAG: 30S ribosomal protein S1, partial [Eggerthellaceae bacterium]|nr:30S ribosomal protein S1 [Eggerthellaceae bacterium]